MSRPLVTVVRYVATYVNADGVRTLMTAQQGRYTYATAAEAQHWIDAVFAPGTNSAETLASVWGRAPRCAVRPCDCYAGHFDPVGIYFDTDDEAVAAAETSGQCSKHLAGFRCQLAAGHDGPHDCLGEAQR